MAKHLQKAAKPIVLRALGVRWQVDGERLTHAISNQNPRLACASRRFAKRGLAVDSSLGVLSLPRVSTGLKRRRLTGVAIATAIASLLVVTFIQSEPKVSVKAEKPVCRIANGEKLPEDVKILRKITLGGLTVQSVRCQQEHYSVTVDSKGEVVELRRL